MLHWWWRKRHTDRLSKLSQDVPSLSGQDSDSARIETSASVQKDKDWSLSPEMRLHLPSSPFHFTLTAPTPSLPPWDHHHRPLEKRNPTQSPVSLPTKHLRFPNPKTVMTPLVANKLEPALEQERSGQPLSPESRVTLLPLTANTLATWIPLGAGWHQMLQSALKPVCSTA